MYDSYHETVLNKNRVHDIRHEIFHDGRHKIHVIDKVDFPDATLRSLMPHDASDIASPFFDAVLNQH